MEKKNKKLFTIDRQIQCFYLSLYSLVGGAALRFVSESRVWWKEFFTFTNIQVVNNVHSVFSVDVHSIRLQ